VSGHDFSHAEKPTKIISRATDILLDNMSADQMRAVVDELSGAATFEASGGLTLDNATTVASTGVDFIAVGGLTHSARILDIGLDLTTNFRAVR